MTYTEKVDPAIVHWVFLLIGSKFAKCNAFNSKKQLLNMPHHLFDWDSIGIEPNKLEGHGQQILNLLFGWPVKRPIVLIYLSTCFDLQAMLYLRLLRLSTWDRNFTNTNAFAKNVIIIEMLRHRKSEIVGHIMTKLFNTRYIEQRGPCGHSAAITGSALTLLQSLYCSHSTPVTLLQSLCTLHSIWSHTGAYNSFLRNAHSHSAFVAVCVSFRKFLFHFTFIFIHDYLGEVGGSQWTSLCCHLTGQHTIKHATWPDVRGKRKFHFVIWVRSYKVEVNNEIVKVTYSKSSLYGEYSAIIGSFQFE